MELFTLIREYLIEDYYEADSFVGVFSSEASATAAIDQLEKKYEQATVKAYEDHCEFMKPEKVLERWEKDKRKWADEFERKKEGSNRWKLVKENLDYYQGLIDGKEFPEVDPFEKWRETSYSWRHGFKREVYTIESVTLDQLT